MSDQTAAGINWLTAPSVPIKVHQMIASGQTPAGRIIKGPLGQKTYVGPVRAVELPSDDWRDGLKVTPDR